MENKMMGCDNYGFADSKCCGRDMITSLHAHGAGTVFQFNCTGVELVNCREKHMHRLRGELGEPGVVKED